jgi:hypothetical protein
MMTKNQAWDMPEDAKEQALRVFLDTLFNAYPHNRLILVIDAEKCRDGSMQATLSVNPQCSDDYWVQFTTPPDES